MSPRRGQRVGSFCSTACYCGVSACRQFDDFLQNLQNFKSNLMHAPEHTHTHKKNIALHRSSNLDDWTVTQPARRVWKNHAEPFHSCLGITCNLRDASVIWLACLQVRTSPQLTCHLLVPMCLVHLVAVSSSDDACFSCHSTPDCLKSPFDWIDKCNKCTAEGKKHINASLAQYHTP